MKICYLAANAFRHIARHKMISAIMCLCIAVGMIMPMYAIFNCNALLREYYVSRYVNEENTIMANVFDAYTDEAIIINRYSSLLPNIEMAGMGAIYSTTLSMANGAKSAVSLLGATKSLLSTDGYKLISGRLPTKEEYDSGDKVAVLRANGTDESFLKRNNVTEGEKLLVQGIEYTVIGSINYPRMMGDVLVPYNSLRPLAENKKLQHWGNFVTKDIVKPEILATKIKKLEAASIIFVGSGAQVIKLMSESYYKVLKVQLASAAMVLVFAGIGFTLIMLSKALTMQYVNGVKLALGANKLQVFTELLIENLVLIITAFGIDILALAIIPKFIPNLGVLIDAGTLVINVGVALILSLIISTISSGVLLHSSPIHLINSKS